uniref:Uncharacterized protein n=1 Tax=Cucumis melo TaxID=3656 RepID=A0A9I9E593_CUCME
MGVETGVPTSLSGECSTKLGQAQFAKVLQAVLQELADALPEKPYVFIQNMNITNGAQVKKVVDTDKEIGNIKQHIIKRAHKSANAVQEKGFNFDDPKLMRGAWRNEPNSDICFLNALQESIGAVKMKSYLLQLINL